MRNQRSKESDLSQNPTGSKSRFESKSLDSKFSALSIKPSNSYCISTVFGTDTAQSVAKEIKWTYMEEQHEI